MNWRTHLRDWLRGYSDEDVRRYERKHTSIDQCGRVIALTKRERKMLRHKRRQWHRYGGAE